MSQKVLVKDFDWVDQEVVDNLTAVDIAKLDPQGDTGWIFEVDLKIPTSIHDKYVSTIFFCEG